MQQIFNFISASLPVILLLSGPSASSAENTAVIELRTAKKAIEGQVIARDRSHAWLMGRDGKYTLVELSKVRSFKTISPEFRGYTPGELRSRLLQEFGKEFQVAGTRHYLVCAPTQDARQYAELFEDLYRTFHHHFVVRGFQITEPEFPLVAVVLPNRKAFADYCEEDGLKASKNLRGYYLPTSNRVALYIPNGREAAQLELGKPQSLRPIFAEARPERFSLAIESNQSLGTLVGHQPFAKTSSARTIDADLAGTMIHEATHQAAFNMGLHPRLGETPKWVVEGLATVFEAPGIRDGGQNRDATARINRDRFVWFGNYMKKRRKPSSLSTFVQSDQQFQSAALDAYSEAWALSFYLVETRPHQYGRYLKTLASRDPFQKYPASERLSDFKKAFGQKTDLLETEFLRYMQRLK